MASEPAVQVQGLRKSYGDVRALCGVEGTRPAKPDRPVGGDRGAPRRRNDGAAHDPVPGRGGPSHRPDRGDRPRRRDRRGHLGRAEGSGRRRSPEDPFGRRRPRGGGRGRAFGIASERPFCEDGTLLVPLRQRRGAIADAVRRLDEAAIGIDEIALRQPTVDLVIVALFGPLSAWRYRRAVAA
jgi:hypothetical protein